MFTSAARDEAMKAFAHHLRTVDSPLIASAEAADQLMQQMHSVLDDVEVAMHGEPVTEAGARRLSWEIGAARAVHGTPPMESLRAAVALFEVLLPVARTQLWVHG